jgi:hypothetical protein
MTNLRRRFKIICHINNQEAETVFPFFRLHTFLYYIFKIISTNILTYSANAYFTQPFMTDNNNYWPFAQGMVNTTQPNIIMSQEQQQQQKQQQQQPPHQQQQQQPLPPVAATHQQQWAPSATTSSESDKRKWGQAYNDYDMNSHANKMFRKYIKFFFKIISDFRYANTTVSIEMDDYSNNEPSEADSPGMLGEKRKKKS